MFSKIPEPSHEEGKGVIPAPIRPQEEASPEVTPYKISFARYKEDECQMNGMDGNHAKATLTILRDVGVYFTSEVNYRFKETNKVSIKPVVRDGSYEILFKDLDDDEEVNEIIFTHPYKGTDVRVFYSTLATERIFYVIAARHDHYDTDKGDWEKKKSKKKNR